MSPIEPVIDTTTQTVTVAQAAVILGIGRASAYHLARSGQLPGIRRLGKRFVVSRQELEHFINPRTEIEEVIDTTTQTCDDCGNEIDFSNNYDPVCGEIIGDMTKEYYICPDVLCLFCKLGIDESSEEEN